MHLAMSGWTRPEVLNWRGERRSGKGLNGSSRRGRAGACLMRAAAARRMRGEGQDSTHVSVGREGNLKRPAQFNSFVRRYICHTTHETYDKTYVRATSCRQGSLAGRTRMVVALLMIVVCVTDDVHVFEP